MKMKNQQGFTLVEVLIASVILIVGVGGMLSVFPQAYDSTSDSLRVSVLNQLAAEKIEDFKSADFNGADLAPGIHPARVPKPGGGGYYPVAGFPADYSVRWIVEAGPIDRSGNPVSNIKSVSVQASYDFSYRPSGRADEGLLTPESQQVIFHTFVVE